MTSHTRITARDHWRVLRTDAVPLLKKTWAETGDDNVSLTAAGVAFYVFTAIVPTLAAIVLTYGLVVDQQTVTENIRSLFAVLPADAASAIGNQLQTVVETSGSKKGWGLLLAIGIAFYGATKGTSSILTALNIAYDVREGRGFVKLQVMALAMVATALVLVLAGAATTTVAALLNEWLANAPGVARGAIRLASISTLTLIVITAAALLYRFGPADNHGQWRWLAPAPVLATVLWLAATAGFGLYASNLGSYGATYGSLGTVIVLLTWLWLSAFAFLLGGELDSVLTEAAQERYAVTPIAPADEGETLVERTEVAASAPAPRRVWPIALLAAAGGARLRSGVVTGAALLAGAGMLAWRDRSR